MEQIKLHIRSLEREETKCMMKVDKCPPFYTFYTLLNYSEGRLCKFSRPERN